MSKKYKHLFDRVISDDNIERAYRNTQKGRLKYHVDSLVFTNDVTVNLKKLKQSIFDSTYIPGEYYRFKVYDPKERTIDTPAYIDKIVQHMINNVLAPIYKNCYIYDSYSCIVGKGTHAAVLRISQYLKLARNYKDPYVVRADIRKFFYTIDRNILKSIIARKITCTRTLHLIYKIIDSSPEPTGLPLGCTTSQLFSNIYLNQLDQYIKRNLKAKYYVRYADDMIIIVDGKEKAKDCLLKIRVFLKEKLNLETNEKKSMCSPLRNGVNMVGFYMKATHRKLRRRSKKRIKNKIKKIKRLIESGSMKVDKAKQIINSWYGHARYSDSFNFIQYLLKRFKYLGLRKKKLYIKKYKLCSKDQDKQQAICQSGKEQQPPTI